MTMPAFSSLMPARTGNPFGRRGRPCSIPTGVPHGMPNVRRFSAMFAQSVTDGSMGISGRIFRAGVPPPPVNLTRHALYHGSRSYADWAKLGVAV